MPNPATADSQAEQLAREKRAVSYDSYDISVRQIVDMVQMGEINISPDYQRHFVWDEKRESELIESLFLGIPVPSLYMATNINGTWEVVDGVQRISTILHFIGEDKSLELINRREPLVIDGLQKLSSFNNWKFDSLPKSSQFQFMTRPLRVTTLNDKSDSAVRYDLFERLNTGAVKLHPQEIRNCVFRGLFTDYVKHQSANECFRKVVKLPANELQAAAYEECVLRFFAFRDRYQEFNHNVQEFLNTYAIDMNKRRSVPYPAEFSVTMEFLAHELPDGIVRQKRRNTTPINLFEAVAVGSALALRVGRGMRHGALAEAIDTPELTRLTTGGTIVGRWLQAVLNLLGTHCSALQISYAFSFSPNRNCRAA